MADEIVSRAMIAKRGCAAFLAGQPRDAEGMHPWTEAAKTWFHAYDTLKHSRIKLEHTAATAKRVDAAQVAV